MLRPTRTVAAVALGFVLLQACDDDGSGGGDDTGSTSSTSTTDDYPSVTGELRELQEACERNYDPDWAEPEGRAGAPGFPDLTAGPEDPYISGRESDDGDDAVDERNVAGVVGEVPPWDLEESPELEGEETPPWLDEPDAAAELSGLRHEAPRREAIDIAPEPDDPFAEPGEMLTMQPSTSVGAGVEGLRQLGDDGRAYGGPRPAIVEAREHDDVLYQREYRRCGSRSRKTGAPRCWCADAWPHNGHGPYWYAYWRDTRTARRLSKYIGKAFQFLR